jgi:hypothetical protein
MVFTGLVHARKIVTKHHFTLLLLVDWDLIANLDLLMDPEKNFKVIMKNGQIYKNTLQG